MPDIQLTVFSHVRGAPVTEVRIALPDYHFCILTLKESGDSSGHRAFQPYDDRASSTTRLNSTRYRNRLQIEHPITIGETSLQLFVSDEVFYDWSFDAWVRNRFAVGVSRKFQQAFHS